VEILYCDDEGEEEVGQVRATEISRLATQRIEAWDWGQHRGSERDADADLNFGENEMTTAEAFEILGMEITTDKAKIKARYRELSLKVHPDVKGSDRLMSMLNEAYNVAMKNDQSRSSPPPSPPPPPPSPTPTPQPSSEINTPNTGWKWTLFVGVTFIALAVWSISRQEESVGTSTVTTKTPSPSYNPFDVTTTPNPFDVMATLIPAISITDGQNWVDAPQVDIVDGKFPRCISDTKFRGKSLNGDAYILERFPYKDGSVRVRLCYEPYSTNLEPRFPEWLVKRLNAKNKDYPFYTIEEYREICKKATLEEMSGPPPEPSIQERADSLQSPEPTPTPDAKAERDAAYGRYLDSYNEKLKREGGQYAGTCKDGYQIYSGSASTLDWYCKHHGGR
jgi:hypothetical protein